MATFSKSPWTGVFFTCAVEREELSSHWRVVALHTQNPCFKSVNSTIIIIGPTPTNSCFINLPCVFRRSRPCSINGVDFLVFCFCQTLPAVCPLVGFLATVGALTFKIGGAVPAIRALCLSLDLALVFALMEPFP